jgi:hypothetical protein
MAGAAQLGVDAIGAVEGVAQVARGTDTGRARIAEVSDCLYAKSSHYFLLG